MTAKQWLNRGRAIDKQISSLLETKQIMRDRLLSITQNYDGDGAQSTKDPHKYDGLVIIENQIDDLIDIMLRTQTETLDLIYKLEDWRLREVLKRRYVDMKSFEQIAVSLGYGWRNIMKLHKKGLTEVETILDESRQTKRKPGECDYTSSD